MIHLNQRLPQTHQVLSKKIFRCLIITLLLIVCTSCRAPKYVKVEYYLNELAYESGIDSSRDISSSFANLLKWEVVEEGEIELIHDYLDYDYLSITLSRLLGINDGYSFLMDNNLLNSRNKKDDYVDEEKVLAAINKAVEIINNPIIENKYNIDEKENIIHLKAYNITNNILITEDSLSKGDIVYLESDNVYKKIEGVSSYGYILVDPELNEYLNELDIEGSGELDFTKAEVIPYIEEDTSNTTGYTNNYYELLANDRKVFSKDGFDISYSIKSSSIDARVSKSIKNNFTMFFDISLSNIKPVYKWDYKDGDVKEAFFKINYRLTNEIGVSCGKYNNYYLDFKNLDSSSFLNKVKSAIKTKEDEVECTIPICTIKTPIPEIPTANINIDVVAKIYVSGKVEIVFYNNGAIGFESKNGSFRVIKDIEKDNDFIVGASARGVAGINFNLEAAKKRLMDIELDGGVRAAVTSTLHLYDENGDKKEEKSEIPYYVLEEVSKENKDVKVCGDLSLNWVLDVQFNTSKTLLYKYGLTYKKELLNSNDQVFHNLTHMENWMFVKKCTRKNRNSNNDSKEVTKINSDKIILSKYSAVVIINNDYKIPVLSIPSGYELSDLVYSSNNNEIVNVTSDGIVKTKKVGSCKVDIKTKDNKYSASINILVSTG